MYLRGQPPPSVNMHWRRFAIKDIPLDDHDTFDRWLKQRWIEKDDLMEHYLSTGRFPGIPPSTGVDATGSANEDFIETEVKLAHWWEVGNIFVVLGAFALVVNILARVWGVVIHGKR